MIYIGTMIVMFLWLDLYLNSSKEREPYYEYDYVLTRVHYIFDALDIPQVFVRGQSVNAQLTHPSP